MALNGIPGIQDVIAGLAQRLRSVETGKVDITPWAPYTPITTVTLGNGTLTAYYQQSGNIVYVNISLVIGSTSTSSGQIIVTLPVAAALPVALPAVIFVASNGVNYAAIGKASAGSGNLTFVAGSTAVSKLSPANLTANSSIIVNGSYLARVPGT